jgi:hypothetical protein
VKHPRDENARLKKLVADRDGRRADLILLRCGGRPGGDLQQRRGDARIPVRQGPSRGIGANFFTDKKRDTESNLDYFGARYYSSVMGRLMSAWSDQQAAVPYTGLFNPQSLNLYGNNNPLPRKCLSTQLVVVA